jgi:3-methyladenine DNA glycosylase AlkC
MSLIKDIYSPAFYNRFADRISMVVPSFEKEKFIRLIFSEGFEHMEWKERLVHTTKVLHQFMPADFAASADLIVKMITQLRSDGTEDGGLAYMFFPDYVATYGLDHFEPAVKALEFITQFISCEFAVRPFMIKYEEQMTRQMLAWSLHESYKVRRFASEGSRPRLPWAMALPALKKDPSPVLPLLENLKNDPSEWVRRSVANHINDIAKDHPDLVIALAARWKGTSKETDAIIKHGCRTLLKQGHPEVLKHYGLESKEILLENFEILTPQVNIGDSLEFTFEITNTSAEVQTIRLEYGVYYKKANGLLSKKVFKISEKTYLPAIAVLVTRKQSFRLITTKVFHTGEHQLSIIVNGEEKGVKSFILV